MSTDKQKQPAEILLIALQSKNSLTVSYLLRKLSITTKELFKLCQVVESWGYKIKRTKNIIRLTSRPDALIDSEISFKLKTKKIGQKVFAYNSIHSTNTQAFKIAESGEPEGTIVTAEKQTKGKGRLGRSWHSPPKAGIYVSIILKPKFKPEYAPGLSIMTAAALADTISNFCDKKVQIKWPNDILINGKKVAGILTELSTDNGDINSVVIGVGINVNHTADDFPNELKDIATSIRKVSRKKVNRVDLLKLFLFEFEKNYELYKKSRLKKLLSKIKKYSSLIGSEVKLKSGRKIISGKAVDIDLSGALLVDVGNEIIAVTSGEVTVVKE